MGVWWGLLAIGSVVMTFGEGLDAFQAVNLALSPATIGFWVGEGGRITHLP
jgi:hypothetical protein